MKRRGGLVAWPTARWPLGAQPTAGEDAVIPEKSRYPRDTSQPAAPTASLDAEESAARAWIGGVRDRHVHGRVVLLVARRTANIRGEGRGVVEVAEGPVARLTDADADAVAAIDVEARAGDFLPSLGRHFLTALYGELLAGEESWGHGVRSSSGEVLGFVVGCTDTEAVFRALSPVRNHRMALATASALLRRPSALIRMVESLFYTSRESAGDVRAELVVIGVRRDVRSGGLGGRMVRALAAELRARGVARYRVTVKEKNEAALRFYARHGFEPFSRFHLYGEGWRVLVAGTSAPTEP